MSSDVVRLPASMALPALIVLLSGLDIAAGLVAKSWADHRSAAVLVLGSGLYVVTFAVYAVSLRFGRLSMVTLAWVVIVTVADMLIDRFVFDARLPVGKWLAMLVAVAALGYVFSGTGGVD